MDKQPGKFRLWWRQLIKFFKELGNKVSKLFDKVIYNEKASLIVSGILALTICVAVNYQELSFQFFQSDAVSYTLSAVPVEVLADENNYEVTGVPSAADITVVGDPTDIQLVKTQNSVSITVDLRQMTEGTTTVNLEPSGLPTGVESSVTPATAEVTLTKKYAYTFFITPDLIVGNGQSESAYQTPTLSVRSATVKATRDKLNAIRTIRAIIDTSGHEGDFTCEAPLVAYDSSGKQVNVTISPSTVTAKVTLVSSAGSSTDTSTDTASENTDTGSD